MIYVKGMIESRNMMHYDDSNIEEDYAILQKDI